MQTVTQHGQAAAVQPELLRRKAAHQQGAKHDQDIRPTEYGRQKARQGAGFVFVVSSARGPEEELAIAFRVFKHYSAKEIVVWV